MASYPTFTKTFTSKLTDETIEAAHVNDVQDEISAIEGGLLTGIAHSLNPSSDGVYSLGDGSRRWLLNGSLLNGATTNYTPVWTNSNGMAAPVVGNGLLDGRYVQFGKLVWVCIRMVVGSTTTFGPPGAGNWNFTVPFAFDGYCQPLCSTVVASFDAIRQGQGYWATSTAIHPYCDTGAGPAVSGFNASFPMAWPQGSSMNCVAIYIKA